MDVGAFLDGVGTIDLLIVLYFIGFFVLGFAQGTIRRLIGIGSILFSWFLAALLAAPLSDFLGDNWTQFSREYSYMIGFGTVFVASVDRVRPGHPDLLQAAAALPEGPLGRRDHRRPPRACSRRPSSSARSWSSSISFFRIPGIPVDPQELPFLRDIWNALDSAKITEVFRNALIPAFFLLTGLFVPDEIEADYPFR